MRCGVQKPDVTLIVATYNRERLLLDTVQDLLRLTGVREGAAEILVVDQSTSHQDATSQQLLHWDQSGVIRWMRTAPPGLTRARNIGLAASQGDWVIFVDDDVRIENAGFIGAHVAALQKVGVGAAVGRILVPGQPPLTVSRDIGNLGYFGWREPGFGSDWNGPTATLRGCNMSFKKAALNEVGGFDERYTRSAFREDTDISYRLRRHGYALWFSADAWLYHLGAPEGGTRDQSIAVDFDLILNDIRFAMRNLAGFSKLAWLARIYGSRVIKAGLLRGQGTQRHHAFVRGMLDIARELPWNPTRGRIS